MSVDMLTAALDIAGMGWPLVALHTPISETECSCGHDDCGKQNGKHPRWSKGDLEHGLDDATTDLDKIRTWWTRWPDANIAVRTGVVCDMFDLDHDDQIEGTKDWPWAVDMPGGPVTRTGNGWHYFLQPTGLRNRTRFTEHCDWRGDGGYAILPPSLHYSGRRYEWFTPITVPLNPCPDDLLAILEGEVDTYPPAIATSATTPRARPIPPLDKNQRFMRGRWTASGVIGRLAMAADGTRNDTLVWAANMIGLDYHGGKATRDEVDRALEALHDVAVRSGLSDIETTKTIKSGFSKGVAGKGNYTGRRAAP